MPSHPNVIKPTDTVVVSTDIVNHHEGFVCSTLYPVMRNGSLDEKVVQSERAGTHLAPKDKARCRQIASPIYHPHFVAHTYYMDIKLVNLLLDDHLNLILIDWEQSGAPH
jgi:thiamine kinase-like enzyme